MAKFEKYKPHLRPGKITPQGAKLIFETDKPVDQIILPIELVDFLLLCNGEKTVAQIIEELYRSKGIVQFKSIYKTLNYLRDRGFLLNGHDLEIKKNQTALRNDMFLSFKSLIEIPIGKRIIHETTRHTLFYMTSMLVIISAILSFQLVQKSWFSLAFLNIGGSFFFGLAYIFITSSLLLTFKNLFKCVLLLFLTGRAI